MLPGVETIKVRDDGRFDFPVGTIFVKTFYQGEAKRGPIIGTRLETRLFLLNDRGWVGYTYVWDTGQTDAYLIDGRLEQRRLVTPGAAEAGTWTFPSRADCMSCHTEVAGRVLGFRIEQLDRMHDYDGTVESQLAVFERLGLFDKQPAKRPAAWPDWENPEGREAVAVRAYLDVHCAMCHQPDGPGNALIDLRFETPLDEMNLLGRNAGQWDMDIYGAKLLVPGNAKRSLLHARMLRTDVKGMPPLAYNIVDEKGAGRVAEWIQKLE
jgi:mono/diheme cytochrome c family protein